LVSNIKGTKSDPLAKSDTEMLASQKPSLFKRGILMEASPLASEMANKRGQQERTAQRDMLLRCVKFGQVTVVWRAPVLPELNDNNVTPTSNWPSAECFNCKSKS
jgi:hypothetical protein